jgi:hypothetical protein
VDKDVAVGEYLKLMMSFRVNLILIRKAEARFRKSPDL